MRLFIALCLTASAALAQKPASDPGFAKLPGPSLRIADSLRIDVQAAKLEPPLNVLPGPKGGLIVYAAWRSVTAFDSSGRRLWSQNADRDRREIADVTAFGWDNAGMWVSDAGFGQIALLDQYGNVAKSIELPSFVRPTFANRKTFPAFESMRVHGRGPNGTMLVMPRGDHLSAGATTYDENSSYLMWVNEDGIIQKVIAKFPSAQLLSPKVEGGDRFRYINPLNQYLYRVAPDGKHIVLVSVDTSDKKMDTVVVRGLNERGDTVFTQKFGYPAKLFNDTQIDSIGRNQWGNDTEYRERRTKLIGRRAPAVFALALDADKSIWLSLRGSATSRSVIGIDATGKYIGKFELPARRVVRAANLGRVWIGELRSDMRGDLVRYRLAKP